MSVYLTCLPGGYVARRFLGTWRSLLLGGLVVAIGHYLLAIPALTSLYAGLSLIALSSGLLGPNLHMALGISGSRCNGHLCAGTATGLSETTGRHGLTVATGPDP